MYRWIKHYCGPMGQGHSVVIAPDGKTIVFIMGLDVHTMNGITLVEMPSGRTRLIEIPYEHRKYQFASVQLGDHVLLFGGMRSGGMPCLLEDVMVLSLKDFTYNFVKAFNAPVGQSCSPAICVVDNQWETNQKATCVLFGGDHEGSGTLGTFFIHIEHKSDSYVIRFEEIVPQNNPMETPPGRFYHSMNVNRNRLWMYGGCLSFDYSEMETYDNQVYSFDWNRKVWSRHQCICAEEDKPLSLGPGRRSNHVTWTDRNNLLVFGGYRPPNELNDMWRLDLETRIWTYERTSGLSFPPIWGHTVCAVGPGLAIVHGGEANWDSGRIPMNAIYLLSSFDGWSIQTHKFFPGEVRHVISSIWALASFHPDSNEALFPEAKLCLLPHELLTLISQYVVFLNEFTVNDTLPLPRFTVNQSRTTNEFTQEDSSDQWSSDGEQQSGQSDQTTKKKKNGCVCS